MAKGAEARPLETGPEQQPQQGKTAPEGAKKETLEKGIAEVKGILKVSPEKMVTEEPAAMENVNVIESSRWEKVKGWANGLIGKAREAFKKPVPPSLEEIHSDQLDFIEKFLDTAKLSENDRENLKEVVLNQLDANEKDPKVIAERMKKVLEDHQARMKQMDAIAQAMQKSVSPDLKLEATKTEELTKEMVKLDPETQKVVAKVYGLLGILEPDMRNPDKKAKLEYDLLTNPKVLADYLRARIPGGKAETDIQIESLARAVALSIETQNALDREEARKEKAEQEKQEKLKAAKMQRVEYFMKKYPQAASDSGYRGGMTDEAMDTFLQKMEAQEVETEKAKQLQQASKEIAEAAKKEKLESMSKIIAAGRNSLNLSKVIDDIYYEGYSNRNADKDFLAMSNALTEGARIIKNELVTLNAAGELALNADPKIAVSNLLFRIESKLTGIKLPEEAKAALGTLLQHEVTRAYQEKLAKQSETVPASQKGKQQVMEYLEGEKVTLEKSKTDALESMISLLGEKLTPKQQKVLLERSKEIEISLALDNEFIKLQAGGWAEIGPNGERRLTAKGLIREGAPHWSQISAEQRSEIEEIQNEALDLDTKLKANQEKLRKVESAYYETENKQFAAEAEKLGLKVDQIVSVQRTDGRIVPGLILRFNRDKDGVLRAVVIFGTNDNPLSKNVQIEELAKWQKEVAAAPDMTTQVEEEIEELPSDLLEEEEEPEAPKKAPAIPAPNAEALKAMKQKVEAAPDMQKFMRDAKNIISSRKTPEGALQGLALKFEDLKASAIAKELYDVASRTRNVLALKEAIDEGHTQSVLTDLEETLGDEYKDLYSDLEAKIKDAVDQHNNALVVEEVEEALPSEEPLAEETSGVRKIETPKASPQDEMLQKSLDKLASSKSYGLGFLASDIANLGSPADRVAADDLAKLNDELTEIMHRARGAGSEVSNEGQVLGADIEAGEDLVDEKTIEPILTGIDEVLSVYSPQLAKAAQEKVKNMVAEHNKKVEAQIAAEGESPAQAA